MDPGRSGQRALHFPRSGATGGNRFPNFCENGLFHVVFLLDLSFFEKGLEIFQGEGSGMITSNEGLFFEKGMIPGSQDYGARSGRAFSGGKVDDDADCFLSAPDHPENDPQMPYSGTVLHEKRVSSPDHGSLKTSSKNDSSRASSRISRISELFFPRVRRRLSTEISPLVLFGVSFHSGRS